MKVYIMGSSGFVGTNLVEFIESHYPNWECRLYDREDEQRKSKYSFRKIDLALPESIQTLKDDFRIHGTPDFLIHLATSNSRYSTSHPKETIQNIVNMTTNICEAIRGTNIILFNMSSSSVYGDFPKLTGFHEILDVPSPMNAYGAAKLSQEAIVNSYRKAYDIKALNVRPCNIYGPYCHIDKNQKDRIEVIPRIISCVKNNEHFYIHKYGKNKKENRAHREFIYVEDVCRVIVDLIEKVSKSWYENVNLNISSGERLTIVALYKRINEMIGNGQQMKYGWIDGRNGEIYDRKLNTNKLKHFLDLPKDYFTPLEVGLAKTIEWINSLESKFHV